MGSGGGVSDGNEGTKRRRMIDSNPYLSVTGAGISDGFDSTAGSKRPRTLDPSSYSTGTGAGSLHPAAYGAYSGGPSWSSSVFNFPLVRIRGLPFNCDDLDVYKFFAGLAVVDCLLVNKNGRFSGEAFVVLSSPMQAELVLERNQQNMGRRYIEVFRSNKQEYYHAIAAEVNHGGRFETDRRSVSPTPRSNKSSEGKEMMDYTELLKLPGLPHSTTESDIVDFFNEYEVKEENARIARRADGKATGEAYVEFPSTEVAKKATPKDKMMIGSRFVELFPATADELRRFLSRFTQ